MNLPTAVDNNATESSSNSNSSSSGPILSQFACLYTKQKTQKLKRWHDGRLVVQRGRAKLFHAQPLAGSADPVLDECEITSSQESMMMMMNMTIPQGHLETERFLIQIEGRWLPLNHNNNNNSFPARPISSSNSSSSTVSSSMQKVMQRKFQRPTQYIPPPPHSRVNKLQETLGKRRRPLQPGELEVLHYGSVVAAAAPPPVPAQHSSLPALAPPPVGTTSTMHSFQHRGQLRFDQERVPQPMLPEPTVLATRAKPDSFVLPTATTATERPLEVPPRQQRPANLQFVRNEFTASCYYGVEGEEDEEENDCNPIPFKDHPWASSNDNAHAVTPVNTGRLDVDQHPSPWTLAVPSSNDDDHLLQDHQTADGRRSVMIATKQSHPRTTSELMALFGAGPTTERMSCSSSSSSSSSGCNGGTLYGKENDNRGIVETTDTSVLENNNAPPPPREEAGTRHHPNDEAGRLQFHLSTPTSSSSSDDDDDEKE